MSVWTLSTAIAPWLRVDCICSSSSRHRFSSATVSSASSRRCGSALINVLSMSAGTYTTRRQLQSYMASFLPRCMECRGGLATRILSGSPSVRLSVKRVNCDKTEEQSARLVYHTKDHLAKFSEKKNGWWGGRRRPLLYMKFWVNRPALERNRRFWTDNSS